MQHRDERRIDLGRVRADGWYERVVAGVAPLERLSVALGDALVALALAAGFRIASLQSEKLSGQVQELTWRRESQPISTPDAPPSEPIGEETRGGLGALRTAVLAALVGDAEPSGPVPTSDDPAEVRAFMGARTLLLAPLFGLSVHELRLPAEGDARVVVAHDGIEEIVPARQLRRFLRQRVVEVLQADSGRAQVSIELAQADLARAALDAGRPEEAVARLVAWIAPLSVFHRTAEGQALDALTRARLARALGTLAEAFGTLRRVEERHEVLRLSLQYALDGEAAPTLYRTLAAAMIEDERFAEAIGPLRRALALGAARREVLPMLGLAFARSGRAVAALACARELRAMGHEDTALEESLTALLGGPKADFEHWIEQGELRDRTQSMPPLAMPEG